MCPACSYLAQSSSPDARQTGGSLVLSHGASKGVCIAWHVIWSGSRRGGEGRGNSTQLGARSMPLLPCLRNTVLAQDVPMADGFHPCCVSWVPLGGWCASLKLDTIVHRPETLWRDIRLDLRKDGWRQSVVLLWGLRSFALTTGMSATHLLSRHWGKYSARPPFNRRSCS